MSTLAFRDAITEATTQIQQLADQERARANKADFKSPFLFYGVSKKHINDIAKSVKRQCKIHSPAAIAPELNSLWSSEYHEDKTLAIVLASLYRNLFGEKDVKGMFKFWLEGCQTWDHVDEICIRITGEIALRHSGLFGEFSNWSLADSMWVRRASLISHLPQIRRGDVSYVQLENSCHLLVSERDFFIRKAVGWVLRELSERSPDDAELIILKIGHQASSLTIREATRKFLPDRREHILGQTKKPSK